jgi:hypothetical protein
MACTSLQALPRVAFTRRPRMALVVVAPRHTALGFLRAQAPSLAAISARSFEYSPMNVAGQLQ